jgi:hypothetical protein
MVAAELNMFEDDPAFERVHAGIIWRCFGFFWQFGLSERADQDASQNGTAEDCRR